LVPSTIKIFKIRRLKYELKLVTPIFEIMNDEKEVFEKHWQERSEAYAMLKKDDIQNVLIYTYRKLIDLTVVKLLSSI
jgi:chloramphenicol O-acetyltransferase